MLKASKLLTPASTRTALIVICLLLLTALANRLYARWDLTQNKDNSISDNSIALATALTDPLEIEVFINPLDPNKQSVLELVSRYQVHNSNIKSIFTDPALDPQRIRKLGVASGGEIFLQYQGRTQRLTQLSEQSLSAAIQLLANPGNRRLLFTVGHGERSIAANTNVDLGQFSKQLRAAGFEPGNINLSQPQTLDPQQDTLVIAGPIQQFLVSEVSSVLSFISDGGNLIWLTEPGSNDGLKALEHELGVSRLPGVVVDLKAQQLQVQRPDFAVANDYASHAATRGFTAVTLLPQSAGLDFDSTREWQGAALLQADENSWTETGSLTGKVAFGDDAREVSGPFPLVLALERDKANRQQRVIVAGDGDFLADAWLGNGGNRELGQRLFNWSVSNDTVPVLAASEPEQLNLTFQWKAIYAGLSLLLLPGLMFVAATGTWYRRQHG